MRGSRGAGAGHPLQDVRALQDGPLQPVRANGVPCHTGQSENDTRWCWGFVFNKRSPGVFDPSVTGGRQQAVPHHSCHKKRPIFLVFLLPPPPFSLDLSLSFCASPPLPAPRLSFSPAILSSFPPRNKTRRKEQPVHGSLARFVTHPSDFCFRLPQGMTLEEGAMCEPVSVGVHACRRAGIAVSLVGGCTKAGRLSSLMRFIKHIRYLCTVPRSKLRQNVYIHMCAEELTADRHDTRTNGTKKKKRNKNACVAWRGAVRCRGTDSPSIHGNGSGGTISVFVIGREGSRLELSFGMKRAYLCIADTT